MTITIKDLPPIVQGYQATPTESLTPDEQKEFVRLEKRVDKGERDSASALRIILDRRLYRETYPNQDEYLRVRWGRSRQSAHQKIQWLRAVGLLESKGVWFDKITVDDAAALAPLQEDPEAMVRAFLEAEEEASGKGRKRTKKMLVEAVERQKEYANDLEVHPDLTYQEFLDLTRLDTGLVRISEQPDLVELAKGRGPLPDSLVEICNEERSIPTREHLLAVARGPDLHVLVESLTPLASEWKKQREAEERLKVIEKEATELKPRFNPVCSSDEDHEEEQIEENDNIIEEGRAKIEVEGADQEPIHQITLGGDFLLWVQGRNQGVVDGKMDLPQDSLAEILNYLSNVLSEGCEVATESCIIVKPHVKDS